MKIAIASTNGVDVNEHFGRSQRFLICELKDDGPKILEERKVTPYSDNDKGHTFNQDKFSKIALALSGCKRIYCSAIGDKPANELQLIGISTKIGSIAIADIRP
ncbi:MAG: hypothetical protein OEM02_11665 [Desulfobulbaceae bacterium]|nr:hypothetical protein [Desulfobulbaceae bacterium]